MDHPTNWKPDPFGIHELRFFSADGKPTRLVMDGGKTSFDKPPAQRPATQPHAPAPPAAQPAATQVSMPVTASVLTAEAPRAPDSVADSAEESISIAREVNPVAEPYAPFVPASGAADDRVKVPSPNPGLVGPLTQNESDRPEPRSELGQPEPMSPPLKKAYAVVIGVLVLSALGLVIVHLHHPNKGHSTQAASSTTTTSGHTTTTTEALPTTLSPSAAAAAAALVSSWSTNNHSAALTVATPAAVAALFAAPYASGQAIDRGCSTSFSPIVCTYGPPGGASPTDPIYQILVSQAAGGWYVSSVKMEN